MDQDKLNFKIYSYIIVGLNVVVLGIFVKSLYSLSINYLDLRKYTEVKDFVETYGNGKTIIGNEELKYQNIINSFAEVGNINSFTSFLNQAALQSDVKVISTKIIESNNESFTANVDVEGTIVQVNKFIEKIETDTKIKEIQNLKISTDKDKVSAKVSIKNFRLKK